jgi:hypothetical protein
MIGLVRDILDTQVLDRAKRPLGVVDGIALELREGKPPRVAYLEVDAVCAWERLGRFSGRCAAAIERLWRGGRQPYRFDWKAVNKLDIDLQIDADAEQTSAFDLERLLRERFVGRIPGSK